MHVRLGWIQCRFVLVSTVHRSSAPAFLNSTSDEVRKMNVHVDRRRIATTATRTMTLTSCSSSRCQLPPAVLSSEDELLLRLLALSSLKTWKSGVIKSKVMKGLESFPLGVTAAVMINHVASMAIRNRRSADRHVSRTPPPEVCLLYTSPSPRD